MKKLIMLFTVTLFVLVMAGCNNAENAADGETNKGSETSEENTAQKESEEPVTEEESQSNDEVEELKLQLQKQDEEAGITIEDNEVYSALNEAINAEPNMGIPDDFSLYPFDILMNPDGNNSIVFLAINRLKDPIKNISFDFKFGNGDSQEYIWESTDVSLPEGQFGTLESNHAMPFMLDITPEQEAIFETLNMDNVDMQVDNYNMEIGG
ncbi:hypothetical protein [Sediminibacillus terrae]|uniref:hypothetical protein n=1 Tax=Sediminibacillus terrae TaxID=1562106 RepID=UPI001296F5EE|nr:hypothetical protein [Sediminibacillus terrae]